LSLEGATSAPSDDGALEIGIRRWAAASIRIGSGPLMLEVGQLALDKLAALVRTEGGRPRLCALQAASAELSDVKVHGRLVLSRQPKRDSHALHAHGGASASDDSLADQADSSSWFLGPLAAANGSIRAEIIDAHLLFDADVTVPIRQGQVDFNAATVEHVGPDSRMGVSRLGLYVDAPNGRSYLYQFSSALVAGVDYERRDALLGSRVTDRGKLRLQPFGEALLSQPRAGQALGFTEQARLLFERTAVSGEVRLGDGRFAAPGVEADLPGRAEGRNVVRLHSQAVGRGLTVEMASLSVRNAVLSLRQWRMGCADIAGAVVLRVFVEGKQLRLELDLANLKISGLRLDLHLRQSG
jgi:hypothetical protein